MSQYFFIYISYLYSFSYSYSFSYLYSFYLFTYIYFIFRFHLRRRPGALSARLGSSGATVTEVEGGVSGQPMTLKINYGGKNIDIVSGLIGDRNTIDGLKGLIYQYSGLLPKSQKLVYKGVVLKDGEIDLKTAKLANGSKLTLIGTAGK